MFLSPFKFQYYSCIVWNCLGLVIFYVHVDGVCEVFLLRLLSDVQLHKDVRF